MPRKLLLGLILIAGVLYILSLYGLYPGATPVLNGTAEQPRVETVKLYFVEVADSQEKLVSVARPLRIKAGESLEKKAIELLLEGPGEMAELDTAIPSGSRLLSLELKSGLARADFSRELEPPGGSAWVTAVREQIEKTLLQFDSVEAVEITVEGESEDVLQP